jgi:hypothetical protein
MSGGLGLRRSPEMSGKIEKAGEARARPRPRALGPRGSRERGPDSARPGAAAARRAILSPAGLRRGPALLAASGAPRVAGLGPRLSPARSVPRGGGPGPNPAACGAARPGLGFKALPR